MRGGVSRRWAGLLVGLTLLVGGCGHQSPATETVPSDPDINISPADYKREILAAMHVYLNDPTGIRDAEIAPPSLKTVAGLQRYVVCLRFNPKKRGKDYAGVKEIAAIFLVGRFDRFIEKAQEPCAGAAYAPFPELQNLSR